jgi:hypothetical protein
MKQRDNMGRCLSSHLRGVAMPRLLLITVAALIATNLSACTVLTVADAAVSVAGAAVRVGATVVETAVDVTAAGVRAATDSESPAVDQPADAASPGAPIKH